MRRLAIKVCGMRESGNIRQVELLAPDMMGFICWSGSSRFVGNASPDYMPATCVRTGVFVNPAMEDIRRYVACLKLNAVQLHGKESPGFCKRVKEECLSPDGTPLQLIKAFSIATHEPFPDTAAYEEYCDLFLFDTHCATMGGSGKTFDWTRLNEYHGKRPFLLSGGIGEEHIKVLKNFSHPMWTGIDLNSRFEDSPAIKNVEKLRNFIRQTREQ